MSPARGERNLLFGILALQLDFISRDALVDAMQTWVRDKDRPLGRILVEQHALPEDTQGLLESLVERHLEAAQRPRRREFQARSAVRSAGFPRVPLQVAFGSLRRLALLAVWTRFRPLPPSAPRRRTDRRAMSPPTWPTIRNSRFCNSLARAAWARSTRPGTLCCAGVCAA